MFVIYNLNIVLDLEFRAYDLLFGVFHRAHFADNVNFNLAGIF